MGVPSSTSHSKLVLFRAPSHIGRCPVDAQQNQGGLPDDLASFRIRSLLPDVGVPILRCSNDAVGVGGPVDGRDSLVVLRKYSRQYSSMFDDKNVPRTESRS
jgi:hypothetical protein